MISSKKGAALLQVLLVTAVLAGMATLILRVVLARSATSKQTRRMVSAQMLIDSCAAEVNMFWAAKRPAVFARDIAQCIMYCENSNYEDACPNDKKKTVYTCRNKGVNSVDYRVTATIDRTSNDDSLCKITYQVVDPNGGSAVANL